MVVVDCIDCTQQVGDGERILGVVGIEVGDIGIEVVVVLVYIVGLAGKILEELQG